MVKILYASPLIRVQQAKEKIKSFIRHHTHTPLLGPRNGTGSAAQELWRFAIYFTANSEHTKKRFPQIDSHFIVIATDKQSKDAWNGLVLILGS